ncbi:hypothetical protein WN944_004553 [Citrus x changshan-huyou]|uniref:Uncharacterized protein n=1 Tax=Citrus x changshan-huyou TaxID=2935761 RepID=A0AAP0M1D1_9ROSI
MNHCVLVVYAYVFGTLATAVLTILSESHVRTLSTFACLSDAGFFIVSKISLDGMSCYVLVVYAHATDDLVTAVLAILFERFFLLTIILVINYFFNKIVFLFITQQRSLNISKRSAQEKTVGTLVALGGAILSTVMGKLNISKLSAQAKIPGTPLVALDGAILSTAYKGIVVILSRHPHVNQTAGISKVLF